jgi:zinc transport system substrate-binding protein
MIKKSLSIIIPSLLILFIFCAKPTPQTSKPVIVVSIPPQKFFVEKIAGNLFDILVMLPPGASPHTYEPKPSQMAALSKAKLYLSIGVEFEKAWLEKLVTSCPQLTVVGTDSGIHKIPLRDECDEPSHAGTTRHGEHTGLDPHIWLSPELVKQQAATITGALCAVDPAHVPLFAKNDSLFIRELSDLQDSLRRILAHGHDKPFLVFHPSWGYFASEFGLRQVSIEVQGKEPTPRELGNIIALARGSGIRTIYVQPQFSRHTAQVIAAQINATVLTADPLSEAWETNLVRCARALEAQ